MNIYPSNFHCERIDGVMVSVLTSSVVDRGCETKYYKMGICCFSSKHAVLMSKSKEWLIQYHNML